MGSPSALVTVPVSADVVTPCGNAVAVGKASVIAAVAIQREAMHLTATSGARVGVALGEEQLRGACRG
jgi:hypothetical protein